MQNTIKYVALLTSGAVVGLVALATPASATEMLEVRIFDTQISTTVPIFDSGPVAGGTIAGTTSDANFSSIQFGADGVPFLPNPDLGTNTLDVTQSSSIATTLIVQITQTGLTNFPSGTLQVANTSDALINNVTSVNQKTFLDSSNTSFGMGAGTLLDNHTPVLFPDSYAMNYSVPTSPPNLTTFSETQVYTIGFGGGEKAQYGGAMQLETVPVPEPASLGLLGGALCGLGLLGRRRRKKNV